jgi:alkanesulfonate monooxygenase SsuD/methylene tetrahydromethanopterin reductase-like flavin-dependent oxidoreductase (luciferase family)
VQYELLSWSTGRDLRALPEGAATDADAAGRAREVLSAAVRDYALVGSESAVAEQVGSLREAGADHVVGYPARGIDAFLA